MNNKNCSICVYQDGRRADGTIVCTDTVRQHDNAVVDCCIEEKPLRNIQAGIKDVGAYINNTQEYVREAKLRSTYWTKQLSAKR